MKKKPTVMMMFDEDGKKGRRCKQKIIIGRGWVDEEVIVVTHKKLVVEWDINLKDKRNFFLGATR